MNTTISNKAIRLNFHPLFHVDWPNTAWPDLRIFLSKSLHDSNSSIILLSELEAVFCGLLYKDKESTKKRLEILATSDWVGISHQPESQFKKMCQIGELHKHIENCKLVVVLSERAYSFWTKEFPNLRVEVIYHPFPLRENKFNINELDNAGVRFLGHWLRKDDLWNDLQSPYKKLSRAKLSPEKFDEMLSNTIQFMDLIDASANNGVLECIRRNTPLLICKHPAVQEYLGADYPFYFESIEEANAKINNRDLILNTHQYLKRMDKKFIDYESFLEDFKSVLPVHIDNYCADNKMISSRVEAVGSNNCLIVIVFILLAGHFLYEYIVK